MKLNRKQVEKLILAVLFLAGIMYLFFSVMLSPLKQRETVARNEIAEIEPKIAAANEQIGTAQAAESGAPESLQTLEQIKNMIPDGEPIAWFPPRIVDFFKRHGIERVTVRLNNEFPEKDLPGFKKIYWSIDLPNTEFIPLAIALSALENEDPLLEITNLQVETDAEKVEYQRTLLTVSTLVKQ